MGWHAAAAGVIICFCILHVEGVNAGRGREIDSSEEITLDLVNGTAGVYRLTRKSSKPWYDGHDRQCVIKAKCETLKNDLCLGSKIPYADTSLQLAHTHIQEKAQEKLQQYAAVLKNIPKCWAVVQPFLCAVFAPKCETIKGQDYVHLPSSEMCRVVMEPCKLVYNTSIFPDFLKCANNSLFQSKCDNDVREMKFNLTGRCLTPLVRTDDSDHFYEGMAGCGLPCRDPLYTADEHDQIRRLVLWGSSLSLAAAIFTVATFTVDWRSSGKYPALVIFYIGVCHTISSLGWLSQFVFASRDDIVCSKDGTRRMSEPSAEENLSCVAIFVLVYYFSIAACVWFVIFTYAWHASFKALGKIQDRIDKNGAYFHLVAWSLPLVLTITTMALGEIDGSSVTGICFVGYLNHPARAGFLLGPLVAVLLVGGFFLTRGIVTLISVRTSSKDIISVRASSKIHSSIVRGAVTAVLSLIFIVATLVCHIYEFVNSKSWNDSFRAYLVCKLTYMHRGLDPGECVQVSRPSVAMLQLQLLCLFSSVCLMASWLFTGATLQTWKRYIRMKCCGVESEEPAKLQKHKLIAQAFARRKEFHKKGRMSISFHNTHTDPVGLNFELNSIASHDFSSTWANNLPRFVERRGALTGVVQNNHSHSQSSSAPPRRNSQDSQISFSLRHVSVESRRNSLDSQVSVKIAEMKTKVASGGGRRRLVGNSRHHHHKTSSSKRRSSSSHRAYNYRKESTTSLESHFVSAAMSSTKAREFSNMSRHSNRRRITATAAAAAAAGLNREQLDLLLMMSNGKALFKNQNLSSPPSSDEDDKGHDVDNGSTASFKIRDSQLSVVLKSGRRRDERRHRYSIGDSSGIDEMAQIGYHDDYSESKQIRSKYADNNKQLCGSKSSTKSKSSRRSSSRQSGGRPKRLVKAKSAKSKRGRIGSFKSRDKSVDQMKSNVDRDHSMRSSLSSSSSVDSYFVELGRLGIQSSHSGVFSGGKTQSRGSKTSCDVGIQANPHEIADSSIVHVNKNNNDCEDDDENQCAEPLLPPIQNKITVERMDAKNKKKNNRQDSNSISESKKLKRLLLPSNQKSKRDI